MTPWSNELTTRLSPLATYFQRKKRAVYQHSVFCPVSIKLLEKPGKKKKEGPQLLLMFAARAGYMYAAF
jgi:hypothetical protein